MFFLDEHPTVAGAGILQYRSKEMERFVKQGKLEAYREAILQTPPALACTVPIYDVVMVEKSIQQWEVLYQPEVMDDLKVNWLSHSRLIAIDMDRLDSAGIADEELAAILQHETAHLMLDHLVSQEEYLARLDEIELEADLWACVDGDASPAHLRSGLLKLLAQMGVSEVMAMKVPHFRKRLLQLNDLI